MKRRSFVKHIYFFSSLLILSLVACIFGLIYDFGQEQSVNTFSVADLCIVIDAGHGGEDGGAVGICGTLEKDINLSIANKLFSLFSLTDIKTIMTRSADRMMYNEEQKSRKKFFDLKNRLDIAQENNASVFISIHQNKFPIEKYKGLQVYYSTNNEQSKDLSEHIQENTRQYLQRDNDRQIKAAGKNIFLLDRLTCPAVLVECGFLSNAEEEKNLNSSEYQTKIAFLIFSSVMEYLKGEYSL